MELSIYALWAERIIDYPGLQQNYYILLIPGFRCLITQIYEPLEQYLVMYFILRLYTYISTRVKLWRHVIYIDDYDPSEYIPKPMSLRSSKL